MNFYQMPSIYGGMNFTKALYKTGKKVSGLSTAQIDELWYKCWDHSVEVFEAVVEKLDPKIIVITSREIGKYYQRYRHSDKKLITVDHPSSAWWNRKREGECSSREKLEKKFEELYG